LGGSEANGPGVFSQQLIPSEVDPQQVYLVTMSGATNASWARIAISGAFPENLDSPSVARDTSNNIIYYFGGRRIRE